MERAIGRPPPSGKLSSPNATAGCPSGRVRHVIGTRGCWADNEPAPRSQWVWAGLRERERRDSNPRLSPHRDSRVNAELGRSCADSASCHIRARRQRAYDGTHVDSRTDDVCQRLASALPTLAKGGKSLYCLTATYPRGGKGALTYSTRYRTTPRRNSSDSPRWRCRLKSRTNRPRVPAATRNDRAFEAIVR